MKINRKLNMAFLLLTLLILASGFASFRIQGLLKRSFQRYADGILPGSLAVIGMEEETQHAAKFANEYVLTGDAEYKKRAIDSLKNLGKSAREHKAYHTDDDPVFLKQLDNEIGAFTDTAMGYMLLRDKGESGEELGSAKSRLNYELNDLFDSLHLNGKNDFERAKKVQDEIRQKIDNIYFIILGAILFALAVSSLSVFIIFSSISRPIRGLINSIGIMGSGGLDAEIDPKLKCSKDEIGDLARAFDQMAMDMKESMVSREDLKEESMARRQTEEEARGLKRQMEFILGATKTGLDTIDSGFNIRYIDEEWKKIYGDPAGKKCYEYFMGRTEVCPSCGIVKALETKSITVTEEILPKEGNRPIQVTTIPFQDEKGEWLVAEVNVDITERKHMEDALRENEGKWNSMIRSISDHMSMMDKDLNILWANDTAKRLFGEDIVGKKCYEVYHGRKEPCEPFPCLTLKAFRDGRIHEHDTQVETKEGETAYFHCAANVSLRDKKGRPIGVLEISRDVTEQKESEMALRRSEEDLVSSKSRLEYLLRSSPVIIYSCEAKGDYPATYITENIPALLGYSAQEFLSEPGFWADHIHPDDRQRVFEDLKGIFKKGMHVHEYRFLHKDGTYRWIRDELRLIRDDKGNPREIIGSMIDVTEPRHLQEQLLHSQKMEGIGRLAGGIAHDFNNLLQTINGYSELLLDREKDHSPLREDLEQIKNAGKKAASLTRQLLTFSRKQIIQPRIFDLNETISDLEKMLRRLIGEDIDLEISLQSGLRSVKADQGQIDQVIVNLAVNARDAMPRGGSLFIKTEDIEINEKDCENIPDAKPGAFVCVSVADTGIGMDKETRRHIFEPFYTTKGEGKGTGLGLSTVYGIVKQHGGCIDLSSEPGLGAIFRVYLPASSTAPADEEKGTTPLNKLRGGKERILLVEDDANVRSFASKALRENGYIVLEASYTQEAMDIFKMEKGRFDMVLSDVVLPDESGTDLVNRIISLSPDTCVLMCSGYSDQRSQYSMIQKMGLEFLEKPYNVPDLLNAVKRVLRQAKEKDKIEEPAIAVS